MLRRSSLWMVAAIVVGILLTGWYGGAFFRHGLDERVPPQLSTDEWLAEGGAVRAMFGWQFASCLSLQPEAGPERVDHCFEQIGLADVRPWAEDDRQFLAGVERHAEFHSG